MEFGILQVSQRALRLREHSIGKSSCSIDARSFRRKICPTGWMKKKKHRFLGGAFLAFETQTKLKQTDVSR
jgi:hypothetical protein